MTNTSERIIPLPILLSCTAMIISIGIAMWTYLNDPLGEGLARYNLATPKDALLSVWKIQESHDLKAMFEITSFLNSEDVRQRQTSLHIWKEVEWRGKKILFCSWEEKGITKHQCEAFEKDASSGYWLPSTIPYVFDVQKSGSSEDKQMSRMIEDWRAKDGSQSVFDAVARELAGG